MGFLRRLLGGEDVHAPATATGAVGEGDDTIAEADDGAFDAEPADDDARLRPDEVERSNELRREFDAGLSDLARRQIEYERYAWQPAPQLHRDGDWILMARWKVQSPEGKDVTLKPGAVLTWVGPGSMSPGAVRFRTEKGVLVDLPAGRTAADGWPEDLQRPRSPSAGAEED